MQWISSKLTNIADAGREWSCRSSEAETPDFTQGTASVSGEPSSRGIDLNTDV